jgi:thiol-disulfide isomerase/thioredoxin
MKLSKVLIVALAVLFINNGTIAAGIVGQKAPKIIVKKWITPNPPSRDAFAERVIVVEFWATWCGPCVDAIPHTNELAEKYSKKGALFIALSTDWSSRTVEKFVSKRTIKYHIGMDNKISRKFHFQGIPTAFVISHTGNVVWQGHPMQRDFETAIIKAIEAAPKPFLDGIELGPFENLREPLSGGKGFSQAYHRLGVLAKKPDAKQARAAKILMKKIDEKIKQKINEAAELRKTDTTGSLKLYEQLTKKFKGTEAIKPAKAAYDELKNNPKEKPSVKDGVK